MGLFQKIITKIVYIAIKLLFTQFVNLYQILIITYKVIK